MENTKKDMLNIPQLKYGDKLYHYTSAAGLLGISEGEFWVTEGHFLNDPSEFSVATDIFEEVIRNSISEKKVGDRFIKLIKRYVEDDTAIEDLQVKLSGDYVISFSLTDDSPLLWSEFSDFYGYCIRFDFEKLYRCFDTRNLIHGRVLYNHDNQYEVAKSGLEETIFNTQEYPEIIGWNSLISVSDQVLERLAMWSAIPCELCNMFFKKKCFEGENEYRFVFLEMHEEKGGRNVSSIQFRIKNESIVPFVKKELNDISCVEAVTIGPKNNNDISLEGLRWFYRSKKQSVEIKQSGMSLRY